MKKTPAVMRTDIVAGDKIIVIKSINNPATILAGDILEVKGAFNGYIQVTKNGLAYNLYTRASPPSDEYCLATREEILKYLNSKKEILLQEINKLDEEISYNTRYASEEEFVAEKLLEINNTTSKDKMVELLKTLKKSNYL